MRVVVLAIMYAASAEGEVRASSDVFASLPPARKALSGQGWRRGRSCRDEGEDQTGARAAGQI
jgi:hypothetical protein